VAVVVTRHEDSAPVVTGSFVQQDSTDGHFAGRHILSAHDTTPSDRVVVAADAWRIRFDL